MFGSKSETIERLTEEIVEWRRSRIKYIETIDGFKETINALETKASNLEFQLQAAEDDKKGWIADYLQLNDRYTLLDSLLKQLRVNVTLPAKKIARQN